MWSVLSTSYTTTSLKYTPPPFYLNTYHGEESSPWYIDLELFLSSLRTETVLDLCICWLKVVAVDQVLSLKIIIFLVKLVVLLAFSIPVDKLINSMVISIFRTISVIDFMVCSLLSMMILMMSLVLLDTVKSHLLLWVFLIMKNLVPLYRVKCGLMNIQFRLDNVSFVSEVQEKQDELFPTV